MTLLPGSSPDPTKASLDESIGGVKVIDFGLSLILPNHSATIMGAHSPSRHYSPERAVGFPYNEKDDVWGMAYLFSEMVLGDLSHLEGCGPSCRRFVWWTCLLAFTLLLGSSTIVDGDQNC